MLKPIRRVVTGLSNAGKSKVIYDGMASSQAETPLWPGQGITLLWKNNQVPTDNSGNADATAGPFELMTAPGFIDFMVFQCAPVSDVAKMSPEQKATVFLPKGGMPKKAIVDQKIHPGMHKHDTTDYIAVLSGEVTLILEEGEVTLKAGDTLVNRASFHAWENRGTDAAIVVAVSVDAKPVT